MSRFLFAFFVASYGALANEAALPAKIRFNRDVRPILAENCFKCHGFDKKQREAGRRLDTREGAVANNEGIVAIAPGKLTESDLHLRIHSADKDERMPPAKSGKKLSARERAILDRWIEQGADYEQHWAYLPPSRPAVPQLAKSGLPVRNAIDAFVHARLAELGMAPSAEANRITLARRVSFDLTGLPPSAAEVEAFLADTSATAYETFVERLLASPAYGERMAVYWLDVVRYADSDGFHADNPRSVWPYRDYVIAAFNENKPFDRFTLEQLAGDLMPDAGLPGKIASTFNRLNLSTEEGGAQPKDYEARTLADRVRAVGTVWLAQTTGCAQCHDHKYDPITTRDFYRLGAFFADIKESALGKREEVLLATPEQQVKIQEVAGRLSALEKLLATSTPALEEAQRKWENELRGATNGIPEEKAPKAIAAILTIDRGARTPEQLEKLAKHFRSIAPELNEPREQLAALRKEKAEFEKTIPRTLASETIAPPRTVRVLPRGDWLNETGEIVTPGVLSFLPPSAAMDAARWSRLDLARWLVARENPLTARVFVNRLWKLFFGTGLSKVLDDFGAQGEPPRNPELLDWLATDFVESGWDTKRIVRLIVTSHAYRQSSNAPKALVQRDPDNREIARQSRFRFEAEFVRDNALSISGLLVRKVGGPSAKPYQPPGYWENLNFPTREWQNDTGENQWRRGLYTHWQRSYFHPSLLAFDAPSREECAVERVRSNIPQQALVLLNDPTYVEAARVFAARMLKEGGTVASARLNWAFQQALSRPPRADELETLIALLSKHRLAFGAADAEKLIKVGLAPAAAAEIPPPELAAWTSVARVILNLHETITRF